MSLARRLFGEDRSYPRGAGKFRRRRIRFPVEIYLQDIAFAGDNAAVHRDGQHPLLLSSSRVLGPVDGNDLASVLGLSRSFDAGVTVRRNGVVLLRDTIELSLEPGNRSLPAAGIQMGPAVFQLKILR